MVYLFSYCCVDAIVMLLCVLNDKKYMMVDMVWGVS